jgi:ADP-heptose:LPS heptosyltransferase
LFKTRPGEIFFTDEEKRFAQGIHDNFVLVEPNVLLNKPSGVNKQWAHYQYVVDILTRAGHRVVQFEYQGMTRRLQRARFIRTATPRLAMAALSRARLYVGPEGGMHHAAAALGVPAVVIFGGFAPPEVLGYEGHVNLTGGAIACGSRYRCQHCEAALRAIEPNMVVAKAQELLLNGTAIRSIA